MNLIIPFYRYLSSSEKGLNGHSNPDLCDAGAVLKIFSYQTKWELVFMWVDCNPVYVEIDDVNTNCFLVFEMRIGMNEFDQCILTQRGFEPDLCDAGAVLHRLNYQERT